MKECLSFESRLACFPDLDLTENCCGELVIAVCEENRQSENIWIENVP